MSPTIESWSLLFLLINIAKKILRYMGDPAFNVNHIAVQTNTIINAQQIKERDATINLELTR